GRSHVCQLQLQDSRVSSEHASLSWHDGIWFVRDLASTNGTWLNGQRLQPGADVEVPLGSHLALGQTSPADWVLVDDAPPQPMVVAADRSTVSVITDGVISIPSGDEPLASIYQGVDGGWFFESQDRVTSVSPGTVVSAAGMSWRFCCAGEWQSTARTQH